MSVTKRWWVESQYQLFAVSQPRKRTRWPQLAATTIEIYITPSAGDELQRSFRVAKLASQARRRRMAASASATFMRSKHCVKDKAIRMHKAEPRTERQRDTTPGSPIKVAAA